MVALASGPNTCALTQGLQMRLKSRALRACVRHPFAGVSSRIAWTIDQEIRKGIGTVQRHAFPVMGGLITETSQQVGCALDGLLGPLLASS
mmetsp:Transcript_29549/g.78173  ORF Transcript_29549/g.78173 Transcript_29549/m.78173 type:complete len:91 (+) Transcript_29549:507-779(+)